MALLEFGEDHYIRGMPYAADLYAAGTVYSDVVNMKNHHVATFVINQELGSTGTATITVQACDDVVPTNRSAVPFYVQKYLAASDIPAAPVAVAATGFTTTAEATAAIYVIMVDAAVLAASGFSYLQMKAVEVVNDPVAGSVVIILGEPRNNDPIPASAIV
jgi:hypothetical protein